MAYSQNKLSDFDQLIEEKAKLYGVPSSLIRAVIMQESGGDPSAKSSAGATGLMQLMPDTAKSLGVKDSLDPTENIDAGTRYLSQLVKKYGLEKGLAAYNAGSGNVDKYGGVPPFKETQDYVKNILSKVGGQGASRENSFFSSSLSPFSALVGNYNKPEETTPESRLSQLMAEMNSQGEIASKDQTNKFYESKNQINPYVKNPEAALAEAISKNPELKNNLDQWLQPDNPNLTFADIPVLPQFITRPITSTALNLSPLGLLAPDAVKEGMTESLSKNLSSFTTPKSLTIGAAMATPASPYILGAMTPSMISSTIDTGKEAYNKFSQGDISGGVENLSDTLLSGLMAAGGAKSIYSGIKPKFLDYYNSLPTSEPAYLGSGLGGLQQIFDKPSKERKFIETVRENPNTPKEVVQGVSGTYDPISNQETLLNAQKVVSENPIKARESVLNAKEATADLNAVGMELMSHFNKLGDFDESIRIANKVAELSTKQGQAIQALSMYDKLGPEGILRLASKTVQDARGESPPAKLKQLDNQTNKIVRGLEEVGQSNINPDAIREQVAKDLKLPNLSTDFAQQITKRAVDLQAMPEGREKAMETALLLRDISELVPTSTLRKISSFQTIAQLYNPKTMIRNVLGNAAFGAIENLKDVVAVPLDKAVSLATGERTRSFAGLPEEIKGFTSGLREGGQEAWKGIDLTNIGDKWEINGLKNNGLPQGRTFRGKVLGNIERQLNVALKAPDRAFYKAAFEKDLAEQMSLAGVDKPTDAMIARANFEGLYRTFQDDSAAARVFSGIKKSLNLNKEFGAGDILLKYPKTPGNLLSRSIDYSPAGFVKSLFELGKAATDRGFDQKAFVDSTSRALIGSTGLTGLGYGLSQLGLLRNKPPSDKDLRAVENSVGLNQSQLNISGLTRWLSSGFDKNAAKIKQGDTLVTYDWAVPLSVSISMGGRAEQKQKEDQLKKGSKADYLTSAVSAFQGGMETLGDQPLISSFTKLAQGRTLPESVIEAAKGIPSSFTPTIFKQATQLFDNTSRNTYDPNPGKMALNLALAKTPYASSLPPRVDPFGKDLEAYQGGTNTPFNVMFNPSFVSKFSPSKEADLALNLYSNTGDNKALPNYMDKKFTFHGIPFELNGKQQSELQRWVGERSKELYTSMASNPAFLSLPDEAKLKVVSNYLIDVKQRGMAKLVADELEKTPPEQRQNYFQNLIKENKLKPAELEGLLKDLVRYKALENMRGGAGSPALQQ